MESIVYQQRGPFDRFFGLCFSFLLAAGAVYIGIQLIIAVLPWLIAIGGLLLIGSAIFTVIRWRRERW